MAGVIPSLAAHSIFVPPQPSLCFVVISLSILQRRCEISSHLVEPGLRLLWPFVFWSSTCLVVSGPRSCLHDLTLAQITPRPSLVAAAMSNSTAPAPLVVPTATLKVSIYGAVSCLVGIFIVVVFLVRPSRIPRKRKSTPEDRDCLSGPSDKLIDRLPSWLALPLDFSTVPIMIVLILWVMQVLGIHDIWNALKGHEDSNLKPYSIMILFFSLAYMSLSLDVTGLFDFIACKAIGLSGGSGRRLFFIFFTLSSLITIVSSNDIVILTLTPIICAMASSANLSLNSTYALLFSQFFAANVWSMLLFIGNPTNIVVAQAFDLDFVGYSRWMALPTLAAGLTCLLILYIIFSHLKAIDLPITVEPRNAWSNFVDLPGAIFGSIAFGICIVFIATSSVTKIPIWIVTLVGAVLMIAKDAFFDYRLYRLRKTSPRVEVVPLESLEPQGRLSSESIDLELDDSEKEPNSISVADVAESPLPSPALPIVLSRLPWKVAPFVIGVFILVEVMSITGLTGLFASLFSRAAGSSDSHASILISVFLAGITSSVTCNIVNNQPMTIMYTNVLLSPFLTIGPKSLRGAMFAVVIGSNLGGNMTLVGALAGIMWKSILHDRGVPLSPGQFAKYGIITMVPVLLATCMTLYAEIVASNS